MKPSPGGASPASVARERGRHAPCGLGTMSYAILRIKKIKSLGSIASAGRHIHRHKHTPNADPGRQIHVLHGTRNLVADVKKRLPEKRRSNAVLAVEMLLTASPEWFKDGGSVEAWTDSCIAWLEATYGHNCVSITRHDDETTEHLHCIIVPRLPNGRLSCDHYFGSPDKLRALQDDYAASMKHLGLRRGIPRTKTGRSHQSIKRFYELCNKTERACDITKVMEHINHAAHSLDKSYGLAHMWTTPS